MSQAKCVICLNRLSMKPETADRRYFDKTMHGWAHVDCDPSAPEDASETLIREILGRSRETSVQRSREDAMTVSAAADHGHVVHKQRERREGSLALYRRSACSCGWSSPWTIHEKAATDAKREHLKSAAIYG